MTLMTGMRRTLIAILLAVACAVPANAQDARRGFYTPPAADTIHPVVAEHGMVVAQEKIAARIGADVLSRGGNAVDAAVATGFAMAVTYPRAGNIGGGGFMVIHSKERGEDITIDYRETAPAATTPTIFLGPDGKPDIAKSRDSALGIGVPGTVAGLTLALEKYGSGKFTLAELLTPAIELARDGAGNADAERGIARLGYIGLAVGPEKNRRRGGGRRGLAVIDGDVLAALPGVDHHKPAAADVSRARIGHGQRESGGHRRIDRIAAAPEHVGADPCRDFLLRHHHAVLGGDGMNGIKRGRPVGVAPLSGSRQAAREGQCNCCNKPVPTGSRQDHQNSAAG